MLRGATIVAKYSYLSDGTKLSATDADGNGLYYLGSLVYGSRNGDLSLESAAFNGGRFIVTSNGIESHYFVTDHLGSVRAVVNNDGEVIERNDYYPFGMRWNAGELSDNRYRYNGKETQSFVNVPYTDYGARMLDSKYRLGWNGSDPLAEATPGFSPFAFCANNPINRIDPNGTHWVKHVETGQYIWLDDVTRKEETPDDYTYIGEENNDILADMGVKPIYVTSINRIYASLGTEVPQQSQNKKGGVAMLTTLVSEGLKGVDAVGIISIGVNIDSSTSSFAGITVTGTLVQPNDQVLGTGGILEVINGKDIYSTPLGPEGANSAKVKNAIITEASINIPANAINDNAALSNARLTAGTTNSNIVYISPINIKFGLQTGPMFRPAKR